MWSGNKMDTTIGIEMETEIKEKKIEAKIGAIVEEMKGGSKEKEVGSNTNQGLFYKVGYKTSKFCSLLLCSLIILLNT